MYHMPVFVFTHYPLDTREGGTNFHFVTEGIQATLEQARDAAKGRTPISGVVAATIRQYLREALIDEMHIAIPPVLLGSGERLFYGIDLPRLGYKSTKHVASPNATHVVLTRAWLRRTLSPSRDIERLNILLLIASLATVCLWWVGFRAREKGWHRHFQANTHTKGHVLSCHLLRHRRPQSS